MTKWMPCPEPDCQGDARYAPPGRGHRYGCPYLGVPRGAIARGEALIAGDPDWMNVTQMSAKVVGDAHEVAQHRYQGDWDPEHEEPVDDFGFSEAERRAFVAGAEWAAGRAETVGNDGLTDAEREEYARQYRSGPAFQSVRTPLDAGRVETTTSTRCPGCGHPACPHPRLECGGEWTETTTEGTQPGCTGAGDCPAPAHLHGCFADTEGHCNDPDDHPAETTTATLMARRGGKTQALIESLLAQAKERGLTVEVVYPETTIATDEDADLRDRLQEAIAPIVAPYTSGPLDPLDVQITDAVMALLEAPSSQPETRSNVMLAAQIIADQSREPGWSAVAVAQALADSGLLTGETNE